MEWIYEPWPWYVSGVMIALVMFLLIMVGKNFGMSGNLRTICSICGAGNKADFLMLEDAVAINSTTIADLHALGFESAGKAYLPETLFSFEAFSTIKSFSLLIIGGFLVGFGARYAGGCTSGHAISGLSNLQVPSLIAVIGFFIGGLLMIHILFPLLF